jgi:hypothetical protein
MPVAREESAIPVSNPLSLSLPTRLVRTSWRLAERGRPEVGLSRVLTALVAHGHGPTVSPCARCAGTAFRETVIVTDGFVAECVRWQMTTFFSYSYCAAADGTPPKRPDAAKAPTTATRPVAATRSLSRRRRGDALACANDVAVSPGNARTRPASSGSTRTSSGLIGSAPSGP